MMVNESHQIDDEEVELLTRKSADFLDSSSVASSSEASISLALLDRISMSRHGNNNAISRPTRIVDDGDFDDEEKDLEGGGYLPPGGRPVQKQVQIICWVLGSLCIVGWALAFLLFLTHRREGSFAPATDLTNIPIPGHPQEKITLNQILTGLWYPTTHEISWFPGPNSEDGLLLEKHGAGKKGYLSVEDIRSRKGKNTSVEAVILMQESSFTVGSHSIQPSEVWPSPDLKTVLVMSEKEKNWRHSYTGKYWLFDVATQTGQPLDHESPDQRIQLAAWSPRSDAVVFTRDNNLFLRRLSSKKVKPITSDGGVDLFYGVPDWVYEEEVYSGNSVTWWDKEGKYIAFLRTNESTVPEYPVQYFLSRPSGQTPPAGEENYPEVRQIKYPKAGAPNPVVSLQFYDVENGDVFSVDIGDNFRDDDRLIIEVVWASAGTLLVRETNRESDIVKVALIDVVSRTGKFVRSEDIASLDGGWVEPSQSTRFIPADPQHGRPHDGYIDTVIHGGFDHLAYFSPLDNPHPLLLTSGHWEVVDAPSAVDLHNGLVYFVGTKEAPTQRHIYSVKLDGSDLRPVTNTTEIGYYDVSFSNGAGYALLKYQGPGIPWQKVISTPANSDVYEEIIEENKDLYRMASKYSLPSEVYQNVSIDGYTLQVVERRPPHFDPDAKYPVLFYLYGGPGSQTVNRKFTVDFQAYVASNLGYLVVTVDGRGTGFIGRKARCIIRGNLGYNEARDQIETAKIWARKPYVDETRMAIWGWSYGGFMTLKTIEQDAGRTFQYGMAVAPVTDWRFYDSIYTERYMHTPQHNPSGYDNSSVSNTTALQSNVRFLLMHGVADDNVHLQNSLALIDKLDLASVDNYDIHIFPDSDHSIYFHNANAMVYERLSDWLVNAFNGEWLKTHKPVPSNSLWQRASASLSRFRRR